MKTDKYQKRFYREWVKADDLRLLHFVAKETDLQILANKPIDRDFVAERVRIYRWEIENYIMKDQRFLTTLKPIPVELSAAPIIRAMAEAAHIANVGPMATVAGVIAEFLGRDLLKKGYREVIIENGGDIFLKSNKARDIGLYTGKSKKWNRLKIKIKAKDTPVGICTSSGSIGHSLSFGAADSVVILAKNATLADAVATATCNRVQKEKDLQPALDFARKVKGVSGVVIILKNNLISWGKIEFSRR